MPTCSSTSCWLRCSRTSRRRTKPLRYIETHAGAGGYDLRSREAQKNREYEAGIGLRPAGNRSAGPGRGAPCARAALQRRAAGACRDTRALLGLRGRCFGLSDSLYLFELHPGEHRALAAALRVRSTRHGGASRRPRRAASASCRRRSGVVSCSWTPRTRSTDEHEHVVAALTKAHRRFATGVYAIWYPVIERRWVERLLSRGARHEHRSSGTLRACRCAGCARARTHRQRPLRGQRAVEAARGDGARVAVACEDLGSPGQGLVQHRAERPARVSMGREPRGRHRPCCHGATYASV